MQLQGKSGGENMCYKCVKMTLKKRGFARIFAILLFALICAAAAIYAPAANAATDAEAVDPYGIPEGSEALITYERYQSGILGFQYSLTLDEAHKNPETLARAADLMNRDYGDRGWTAEADADGSAIFLTLTFDSFTEYYIAAGITGFDPPDDGDDEGITTRETPFYIYTTNEMQTVFAEKDGTPVEYLETVAAACGVFPEKLHYRYFYATKYKKSFTSNADTVVETNDLKLHIFDIPRSDLGKKISITSRNPNADNWYYLVIGIGGTVAVATGIVIAVIYFKKKEN